MRTGFCFLMAATTLWSASALAQSSTTVTIPLACKNDVNPTAFTVIDLEITVEASGPIGITEPYELSFSPKITIPVETVHTLFIGGFVQRLRIREFQVSFGTFLSSGNPFVSTAPTLFFDRDDPNGGITAPIVLQGSKVSRIVTSLNSFAVIVGGTPFGSGIGSLSGESSTGGNFTLEIGETDVPSGLYCGQGRWTLQPNGTLGEPFVPLPQEEYPIISD